MKGAKIDMEKNLLLDMLFIEFLDSKDYVEEPTYAEEFAKLADYLEKNQTNTTEIDLEESFSHVSFYAERQGFYNGFQCAVTLFRNS